MPTLAPRLQRPTAAALLAASLLPSAAPAHPHIFIDGGVDFLFDAEGRLSALRVTWIYDPLNSLFMLEDLDIAPEDEADLPAETRARLAAYQTEWDAGFDGDSYLEHDGVPVALSGPRDADAEVRDGQVVIRFRRDLAEPLLPGTDTEVAVYDPTYFTAYAVTDAPRIEGPAPGCHAEARRFRPDPALAALQEKLAAVPIDADPEGDPGALFADRIRLTCD
jgi:ABC-type uncharacterized transport system substrate-binding protein